MQSYSSLYLVEQVLESMININCMHIQHIGLAEIIGDQYMIIISILEFLFEEFKNWMSCSPHSTFCAYSCFIHENSHNRRPIQFNWEIKMDI